MQLDAAPRPGQPFLHELGVVIARVVRTWLQTMKGYSASSASSINLSAEGIASLLGDQTWYQVLIPPHALRLVYESRSGLIALLHRLRLEYHKPEVISRKLDPKTQKAFIASYENLMNSMGDDEVAMFVDTVHPTHAARPVGCWAPKGQKLAI